MCPLQVAGTTGGIRPAKKKLGQFPEGYRASVVYFWKSTGPSSPHAASDMVDHLQGLPCLLSLLKLGADYFFSQFGPAGYFKFLNAATICRHKSNSNMRAQEYNNQINLISTLLQSQQGTSSSQAERGPLLSQAGHKLV